MTISRFDPTGDLIIIRPFVWGAHQARYRLRMVLDTGAAVTVVAPFVLDQLGYSARDGVAITTLRSAVAEEPGYLIRVARFRALGHELSNFLVHAHDLPDEYEIDGLLDLDFLRRFRFEIDCQKGLISLSSFALDSHQ